MIVSTLDWLTFTLGKAERQAKQDATRDMGGTDNCKHPAPWNSVGPTTDNSGKKCTIYSCNECGKTMRTQYYS